MYKLRRYSLGDMGWDDMTDSDKNEYRKKKGRIRDEMKISLRLRCRC